MSARTDSEPQGDTGAADATGAADEATGSDDSDGSDGSDDSGQAADADFADADAAAAAADAADEECDQEYDYEDARRARWTATATGALLTLAGLAASLMRLGGAAPAFVPAAYALGAVVCAVAALLGARGRTRRALWLLIAGVMVMAFGDQAD
ncbi:hypothetical protein ACH4U3_25555 [Streptomyces griseoruber]|uniref:hypothetical protein n=1 Tax=Streptomyces griseoruber TaxID=1943 RepID=UPI0037B8E331